jgi:hypothetical protein
VQMCQFFLNYTSRPSPAAGRLHPRLGRNLEDLRRLEAQPAPPVVTAPNKLDPPKIAEFLLTMLASTARADAMVGDLNEHFARDCEKFGRARAVRLYWARTMRSLWPLLRRAIGKALKWGA